jgi:predicted aspartyl protease
MPTLTLRIDHTGQPVVNFYVAVGLARADILKERGISLPGSRLVRALVDTGASRTVIEERILEELGLSPVAEADVHTASSGRVPVKFKVYAVEISLAEEVIGTIVKDLPVLAAEDLGGLGVQMLLGRDILRVVVLTYNGPEREFRLEFDDETVTPSFPENH